MASSTEVEKEDVNITSKLDEAQKVIVALKRSIDDEAAALQKERSHFVTMSKKLDTVHLTKHIKLNIGGQLFETSLETLRKDPESMLASMFSERFGVQPNDDGAYFIDRDGRHFCYILNYLRTGKLIFQREDKVLAEELFLEAQFYQIKGIEHAIWSGPKFKNSPAMIPNLSTKQKEALISFLPTPVLFDWKLLFSSTGSGWNSSTFHNQCNNKGPTVVLAKSGNNIFGGYSQEPWTSNNNFVKDPNAFLFSLANSTGDEQTKIPQQNDTGGIWCSPHYCPAFGTASGWCIVFSSGTSSTCSIDNNNVGFQCPQGQQLSTFLLGTTRPSVMSNLEVFGLESSQ